MQITIKSVCGKVEIINATPQMTIGNILGLISEKINLPIDKIRLVNAGRCIEYDYTRTLESWGILDNAIIHLVHKQTSILQTIPYDEYNTMVELINSQKKEIEILKQLLNAANINLLWKSCSYE